jgi:hypothetical protein
MHLYTNNVRRVTIDENGNTGFGTATPVSAVEVQSGLTTVGAILTLSTKEPTVVANDVLGEIDFRAPLEASGSDAVLVGASITAIAEGTFDATSNPTSLQFRTGASEAATTKATLTSAGNFGIGTTNPAQILEALTSAAAKSAIKISGGVGGENSGGLILNDTFDFRSSAIIGNILFNAKENNGSTQPEKTFAEIVAFIGSNAASNYESYLSFRTTSATGVIGSRMAVRHNKIDAYEDIYMDTGHTVRDASGNDVLMHGYGEMYVDNGTTAQSIPTGAGYTKLTGFATNGEFDNSAVTADVANDKIIIKKSGKYLVTGSTSFTSGTNSVVFRAALFAGGTEKNNVHWARKVGTGSDVGSAAFTGIIDVDVSGGNVDVDVRIRHDQAGNIDFTPMYMNLTITEVR